MTSEAVLKTYLRLSDIMYQALRVCEYDAFENALEQRQQLVDEASCRETLFNDLADEDRVFWQKEIRQAEVRIESAMSQFRKLLEEDLNVVQASKAKLRRQQNVKKYYGGGRYVQIPIIDRLK